MIDHKNYAMYSQTDESYNTNLACYMNTAAEIYNVWRYCHVSDNIAFAQRD